MPDNTSDKNIKSPLIKPGSIYPGFTKISGTTIQRPHAALLAQIGLLPLPLIEQNLPDDQTKQGNIFNDKFNANLYWYLPSFEFITDPDDFFGFSASTEGVDSLGNPFHKVCLTVSIRKVLPDDVVEFQKNNNSALLQEIPLTQLTAVLSINYKDAVSGNDQCNSFPCTNLQEQSDVLRLTFGNVIGNNAVILYSNLKETGDASINLSAGYDAWKLKRHSLILANTLAARRLLTSKEKTTIIPLLKMPIRLNNTDGCSQTDNYMKATLFFTIQLPLGSKYSANIYQLSYTICQNSQHRPIINIEDLKSFNVKQSEFTELKCLGDISNKYPSIKKLYVGVLSKTIIIIPNEYLILRESNVLNVICAALVDSTAEDSGCCKFEFDFIVVPRISPIELLQLTNELAGNPSLAGYSLTLPDTLDTSRPPAINTIFKNSCQIACAPKPNCFTLSIEVKNDGLNFTAVVNANLFIKQLSSSYIPGTIYIKLDDNLEQAIETTIILSFHENFGTEGVQYQIDQTKHQIILNNCTPYDFLMHRYAIVTNKETSIMPLAQQINSMQTTVISYLGDNEVIQVLLEYSLLADTTINKSEITDKYLQFLTQDVQNTQYTLAFNAYELNFTERGIENITVQICIHELPGVSIPVFSLYEQHKINTINITIPIQQTISSLGSTLQFIVHYKDNAKPDFSFSQETDFIENPTYVIKAADIPKR